MLLIVGKLMINLDNVEYVQQVGNAAVLRFTSGKELATDWSFEDLRQAYEVQQKEEWERQYGCLLEAVEESILTDAHYRIRVSNGSGE